MKTSTQTGEDTGIIKITLLNYRNSQTHSESETGKVGINYILN